MKRSLVDRNVRRLRVPRKGGHWSGEEGNSRWIPDRDALCPVGGRRRMTGAQLMRKFRFNCITYSHGEPDFMPFADRKIGVVTLPMIPGERLGAAGSYALARQQTLRCGRFRDEADLKRYMKTNNLVWHECGDGHTMLAVPREINQAFVHTGAIGIARGMEAFRRRWQKGRPMTVHRGSFGSRIVNIRCSR